MTDTLIRLGAQLHIPSCRARLRDPQSFITSAICHLSRRYKDTGVFKEENRFATSHIEALILLELARKRVESAPLEWIVLPRGAR